MIKHESDRYKEEHIITQKDFYKLGENIRNLRKCHFENQEDLALAINVTVSAISNYETGQRVPSREELMAIAKHYNITPSQLLYRDFSKLNYSKASNILVCDPHNIEITFGMLLPIISSESSENNEHFKKALDLHCKVFNETGNTLINEPSKIESWLNNWETCEKLYKKAADENIEDAYANLLWFPMLFSIGLVYYQRFGDSISLEKDAVFSDSIKNLLFSVNNVNKEDASNKEKINEFEEVLKEFQSEIYSNIYALKASNDASLQNLADYYIALGYIFNVFKSDLTYEENNLVGHEMMHINVILKNQYAVEFSQFYNNIV